MKKQKVSSEKGGPSWRSPCPVARTLDIVGDRWTLLVIRDLLHGKQTYGELQRSPEGIPTNILAERLRRLEKHGLVSREPYQDRPRRYAYHLTEKGRALGDALGAMVDWGLTWLPGTHLPPPVAGDGNDAP